MGVPSLDALLAKIDAVGRWRLTSIQHVLQSSEVATGGERASDLDEDEYESGRWIALYDKGDGSGAEEYLVKKLDETKERRLQAKLYNDLGYIRCGPKLKDMPLARKNLETALDLHYFQLPLTLLNLSYIDIEEGEEDKYETAIERIEEALLLTFSRLEIEASYLRLKLPENHLGFRERWEQHPANVLEASYVNLAYALLKSQGYSEALDVLREGLSLLPSSIRLKHALARLYLFAKRADLAKPIYEEISRTTLLDKGIELEIKVLSRGLRLAKEKPHRKRRKA
jgi:tetratricopeptide (TPR) repeat protein